MFASDLCDTDELSGISISVKAIVRGVVDEAGSTGDGPGSASGVTDDSGLVRTKDYDSAREEQKRMIEEAGKMTDQVLQPD